MDIDHVARLANLPLSDDERETLASDLSVILDYVKNLKAVNVENVKSTSHPTGMRANLAEDKPQPSVPIHDGFFKTKGIFQE